MIKNLDAELTQFRARAKEGKSVKIHHQQGYSSGGGGGISLFFLMFLALLGTRKYCFKETLIRDRS